MLRHLALLFLLLLPAQLVWADDRPPQIPKPNVPPVGSTWSDSKAFMVGMFGTATPRLLAIDSDFDNDGKVDWAGIVEWDGPYALVAQLYVLMRQPDATYKLTEVSQPADTYRSGLEDLEAENHGFEVAYSNSCAANCHSVSHLHFKLYKGEWRLIGRDDLSLTTDPDKETRESYNYLTGREIDEVMAPTGKVASSTVTHTDHKASLLRDTSPLGP